MYVSFDKWLYHTGYGNDIKKFARLIEYNINHLIATMKYESAMIEFLFSNNNERITLFGAPKLGDPGSFIRISGNLMDFDFEPYARPYGYICKDLLNYIESNYNMLLNISKLWEE